MELVQILDEWDADSLIDQTVLAERAINVPKLHAKYLRYFTYERLKLKQLEGRMRLLRLKKFEHYTQGPFPDTKEWKMPASGKILRTDTSIYLEADEDVIKLQNQIDLASEKVDAIESILNMIKNRGFLLNSIMTHQRWVGGA